MNNFSLVAENEFVTLFEYLQMFFISFTRSLFG